MEKARQKNFSRCSSLDTSLPTATPVAHLSLILTITWLMVDTGQNESVRDYGSDVPTDFESEMFRSTTSKAINKSLPATGRTRNVGNRRGEV